MKNNDVKNLRLKVSECGKALESCGIVSVTIAQLNPCGSLTPQEQHEVANRIVLAANHHDELVGMLEGIIKAADDPDNAKDSDFVSQIDFNAIRSLLTKLKG